VLFELVPFADGLVKKLEELEKTANNYRSLMEHTRRLLKAFFDLSQSHRGEIVSLLKDFNGGVDAHESWKL
jgi:hypothetical protein